MRFFVFTILCLTISLSAFSQNQQSITGQVLQLSDSSPIFNAHIYFEKTALGTTTNEEGNFRFHFPEELKKSSIQISCIGYKPDSISLSEFQNKALSIFIEEDNMFLSEVVVSPIDPKSILEKAIKKLGQNYPKEKIEKTIYYKESFKQNGKSLRLLEVVATIASDGFSSSRQNPEKYDLFIDQKRPGYNYDSTFEGGNGIGVLHGLQWTEEYLIKRKLNKYNFSYEGKSDFKNHEIYKISITEAELNRATTTLYITVDEFAIVAIRQSFLNPISKNPTNEQQFRFLAFDLNVDFMQLDDGYWYIHSIDDFRESISNDGTITKVERSIRTTSINKEHDSNERSRIKRETDLYRYPVKYNPEFWDRYNAPIETSEELKAKQDFIE
jgi:hypothetical protein